MLRCLEIEPAWRYPTAAQLAFDLSHPDQVKLTTRSERLERDPLTTVMVWYTSTPIEQGQKIADAWQKGRHQGGDVPLRQLYDPAPVPQQEMDAGRVAVDVLTHSEPAAANALGKKGFFVAFKPVNFDKVPEAAKDPNGLFVGQRLNMMTHYLRSDKVAAADEPKTWDDLLDPKYKGKLVMTDPSFTSLQVSVVGTMAKARGWPFYEKLRGNDVMIVQGNQQVSDMLKRGERLIAVGALNSYAADLKKDGHPIKTLYPPDGVFVIPSPTSVVKGSPNPNAAKLFAQFMIGDTAQNIFPADGGLYPRASISRRRKALPISRASRSSRSTTSTSRRKPAASSGGSTRSSSRGACRARA